MKTIHFKLLVAVISTGLLFTSCYEKFDPGSYSPPLNIGGFTSADEVGTGSLVAYWSFDNTLVERISGVAGANTGTAFNPGIKSGALQGANNSYVVYNTPTAVQNLRSFTVTAWVNMPQNTSGIVGIMDIANSGNFWGNLTIFWENGSSATTGQLKIHVNNNGADAWLGNYAVPDPWNKWIQIGVTYDAAISTFKVFVNGARIATNTIAGFGNITFQNASKMVFGTVQFQTTPSLNGGSTQPWASYLSGQLDEVRIYNKALTEAEVSSLSKLEARGK